MQQLILPINRAKLTASIDTKAYENRFGFRHYGTDWVSETGDTRIWGSGEGTVLAAGWDTLCGNVLAVRYDHVVSRTGQTAGGLIFRYFHLSSFGVSVGQKITKDTVLGRYGKTGQYAGIGAHLHLEADLDTSHPLYTPTVKSSNFLKGTEQGAYSFNSPQNTVVSPLEWLYVKTSPPDKQSYYTAKDVYIRAEDGALGEIL